MTLYFSEPKNTFGIRIRLQYSLRIQIEIE